MEILMGLSEPGLNRLRDYLDFKDANQNPINLIDLFNPGSDKININTIIQQC